jgi:hypothetical protein
MPRLLILRKLGGERLRLLANVLDGVGKIGRLFVEGGLWGRHRGRAVSRWARRLGYCR